MKKRTLSLLLAALMLAALLLSGCGASSSKYESPAAAAGDMMYSAEASAAEPQEAPAMMEGGHDAGGVAANGTQAQSSGDMQADKIIYSAYAEVETTDYDATIQGVYDMVAQYGGFVESSSVSGSNYYQNSRGYRSFRSASFTLRIPSESFKAFTSTLSNLGNVPRCSTGSENVTARYYDTQARLDAYHTQETRLLEMLEVAESVEDMLAIQQQLTEVQYMIDSLQSTLTNYDRQVNYSTVNLDISEVEEYTETPVVVLSYWEKMQQGFLRSLKRVGEFFSDLFLWLGSNLPALLVWVVVLAALALLGRRWYGRRELRAARRAERRAKRLAKKAARRDGKTAAPPEAKNE